jgi:hypothetical protein
VCRWCWTLRAHGNGYCACEPRTTRGPPGCRRTTPARGGGGRRRRRRHDSSPNCTHRCASPALASPSRNSDRAWTVVSPPEQVTRSTSPARRTGSTCTVCGRWRTLSSSVWTRCARTTRDSRFGPAPGATRCAWCSTTVAGWTGTARCSPTTRRRRCGWWGARTTTRPRTRSVRVSTSSGCRATTTVSDPNTCCPRWPAVAWAGCSWKVAASPSHGSSSRARCTGCT